VNDQRLTTGGADPDLACRRSQNRQGGADNDHGNSNPPEAHFAAAVVDPASRCRTKIVIAG
jgi:hypothetical protein